MKLINIWVLCFFPIIGYCQQPETWVNSVKVLGDVKYIKETSFKSILMENGIVEKDYAKPKAYLFDTKGNVIEVQYFDFTNTKTKSEKWIYNSIGQLIRWEHYDLDNKLTSAELFKYSLKDKLIERYYNDFTSENLQFKYFFEKKNLIRSEFYRSSSGKMTIIKYTYDTKNRLLTENKFSGKDLILSKEYTY